MKGFGIFLAVCLFVLVCIAVGLYVRNWSRRHRFISEFGISPHSDSDIVKRAIFLRLKERKSCLDSTEKQLAILRRGIDQLQNTSDLAERQKEIDKLSKYHRNVSAQVNRARHIAGECLSLGGHDPKFLMESVDWCLKQGVFSQ